MTAASSHSSFDNYIAGEFRPGMSVRPNHNPSDRTDLIGLYACGEAGDVLRAAEGRRRSATFLGPSSASGPSRSARSHSAAIATRADELGAMLAREEGKVLA